MNIRRFRAVTPAHAFVLSSAALIAGCRDGEQIRTFTVPKQPVQEAAATPVESAEPTDRMLAAILPVGDQAYFFKVVGPIPVIDKHADAINNFFGTLTIADGRGTWTLPEGWAENPGSPPRLATILVPVEGKPLEITVNTLPWTGSPDDFLSNVNRWRGQLKLGPIGVQELPSVMHETKNGELAISIVDMKGNFQASSMMGPFAGGPFSGGATPPARNPPAPNGAGGNLPAGHPPIGDQPVAPPQAAGDTQQIVPQFTAPDSWKVLPAEGMRKAAFQIGDGDQKAVVTVIDFNAAAGPMIADPRTNVNRWRREVGLPDVDEATFSTAAEKIEIDGQPATYAAMIPDAS